MYFTFQHKHRLLNVHTQNTTFGFIALPTCRQFYTNHFTNAASTDIMKMIQFKAQQLNHISNTAWCKLMLVQQHKVNKPSQ